MGEVRQTLSIDAIASSLGRIINIISFGTIYNFNLNYAMLVTFFYFPPVLRQACVRSSRLLRDLALQLSISARRSPSASSLIRRGLIPSSTLVPILGVRRTLIVVLLTSVTSTTLLAVPLSLLTVSLTLLTVSASAVVVLVIPAASTTVVLRRWLLLVPPSSSAAVRRVVLLRWSVVLLRSVILLMLRRSIVLILRGLVAATAALVGSRFVDTSPRVGSTSTKALLPWLNSQLLPD